MTSSRSISALIRTRAVVDLVYPPGTVSIESLSGAPVVGQPAEDSCGLIIDRQLERLGVTPHYGFRSHDNGAVQGMVGAGMGVAIMPLLSVDIHDRATSIRTTEPALAPRDLSIVWGQGRTLSPLASRFANIVAEVCADLLAQLESSGVEAV